MKKLTEARRHYQLIVTAKRTCRSLESKRKLYELRWQMSLQPGQEPAENKAWKRTSPRSRKVGVSLVAPEIFDLSKAESRAKLLKFIRNLRQLTLGSHCRVSINFRKTKTMYPDGTLLFAAELDRINRETKPHKLIRCNYPDDNIVYQLLQHLGLLEMMGQKGRATVSAENVKYWKVDSDNRVDGQRAEPVIEEYRRMFSSHDASRLYSGLTEAMTNCKHHAYVRGRESRIKAHQDTRWWMFSQLKDEQLSVAICDLGIGIPSSLKQGRRWSIDQVFDFVDKIGLGRKDSYFIKAAMALGRSRTNEEHRGKGLPELKTVIESVGAGYLKIFSDRGFYYYSAKDNKEDFGDFSTSVPGTLIQWKIPVHKASANDR